MALECRQFGNHAPRFVSCGIFWRIGKKSEGCVNLGHRVFIVEGDSVTPISQKLFDDFYLRRTVIYTLANRKPKEIMRIDNHRVKIAAGGALDPEHQMEVLRLVANRIGPESTKGTAGVSGPIVDAARQFDERRWKHLHPKLSGPAHKRILEALFR